jgi:pimeloyl-ACP methyl ester carboxylesterase
MRKSKFVVVVIGMLLFPFIDRAQTQYVRQYIRVASKKMSYTSFGLATRRPGAPVILLESGYGGAGSLTFTSLYPSLSKFAAGIGYDRNGEGGSEEDTTLVTDAQIVGRLHAFLEAVKVAPPYLLVGHSLGGPFIRMFVSLYPAEVAGLVFIDAPDFMLTDRQEEEIRQRVHDEKGVKTMVLPGIIGVANDTLWGPLMRHRAKRLATAFQNRAFREYDSLAPLPDIPVVVLISYNNKALDSSRSRPVDRARFEAVDQFRMMNYAAMIANNHNSGVVLLPGYQHFVYRQDPELVVSAIRRVYESAVTRVSKK